MTARRLTRLLIVLLAATQVTWTGQAAPIPPAVKGLAQLNWSAAALGDRALLGVETWYAWAMGACSNPATWPACVPMNRNWDMAVQTYCPPFELLGNEPTNPEPGGHPIAASVAASVTLAVEAACPQTKIVAANIHLNNHIGLSGYANGRAEARQWVIDYLAAYELMAGREFPHTLGIHCYAQWAYDCWARLDELKAVIDYGGAYWLTEFGLYGPAPFTTGEQLALFLRDMPLRHPDVERYYIWTNRSDPNCCSGWPFELVNGNGTLTAMGQVYAAWTPPTVSQAWFPVAGGPREAYP